MLTRLLELEALETIAEKAQLKLIRAEKGLTDRMMKLI